jgi:hypothetical protein
VGLGERERERERERGLSEERGMDFCIASLRAGDGMARKQLNYVA